MTIIEVFREFVALVHGRGNGYRLIFTVVMLAFLAFFLSQLTPLIDRDVAISRAAASTSFEKIKLDTFASIDSADQEKEIYFEYPASELVIVTIHALVVGMEGPRIDQFVSNVRVRFDRLIIWVGTFTMMLAVFMTLFSSNRIIKQVDRRPLAYEDGSLSDHLTFESTSNLSSSQLFARDVELASTRADALFARSTLLLSGGIVMAFIGVAIFYVTLPETAEKETLSTYWPKVVRPTGVLVFIEAIAWFLLRQYRSLVEDYKWFYKLYLKRSNYLVASRVLSAEKIRHEDLFIAISLVQEDFSGRLKTGETTESIEALKLPEDSPISEVLRTLASLGTKSKFEEPKDIKGKSEVG